MLAKKYRLPMQTIARAAGKTHRRSFITIHIFPPQTTHSRFGVRVSAKTASTAVRRNALKRLIFAALERNQRQWPLADYRITIHPPAARATTQELYEQLIPPNTH